MYMLRLQKLVAAALLPLVTGCYSFTALPPTPAPAPATYLRLHLARPGDYRLTDVTMNDVGEIDGELVTMDDSAVVLSASRLVARSGFEHLGEGATLRVPRASIGSIDVKRLSPVRTALFVGGLVALGVLVRTAMTSEVSGAVQTGGGVTK